MFDRKGFIEFLKAEFPEGNIVSGGREFCCRCRLCGDSRKSDHGHFYISLDDQDGLIRYHCFKCEAGGFLTSKVMRQLADCDSNLLLDLNELFKQKSKGVIINSRRFNVNLRYPKLEDTTLNKEKMQYISDRLGLQVDPLFVAENKICLDVKQLLDYNGLEYTRHPDIINQFSRWFIGFISMNNMLINMRNLSIYPGTLYEKIDTKYVNYRMFHDIDTSKRFYALPCLCDLNKKVRVNIAEGSFDILAIKYHLRGGNVNNEMYIAAGSKAYGSVIKMCMEELGLANMEVHVYLDNDVEDYIVMRLYNICTPIGIPITFHNNLMKGQKDFGVPKYQIKDITRRL